ncbi:MAG TPA: glycosyltransferase family 39 protein [Thermoanaerobaculia bacterium]|nr:glycosyltransferase family 39 protein [Thermoanaerobaculia bacterium]
MTLIVVAIRITAPSDLATGDQPYQVNYILDIAHNGNWIVQHLRNGTPASKPPLYNWLAAPLIAITGTPHDFLLKLPSLVAGLLLLFLTWRITRRLASERAAVIAALLLVTTTMYVKLVYFARTDMLLAMFIALQIDAALRERPLTYSSAAALAMLTKGPIGILLPLLALSGWWVWRGEFRERWRTMRVAIGLPLSMIPFACWFGAAVYVEGRALWDQLVYAETLDRFSAASSKAKEHRHLLYYIPHFLVRFAPASLFATVALFRVEWRKREEPVLLAVFWVVVMLALFSIVPSKRADRLFPLLPGVCALAGWAIATPVRGTRAAMNIIAALLLAAGAYAASGAMAYGVVQIAGALLVLIATAMFVFRAAALPLLIAALLVVNGTYQHQLSVPAVRMRLGVR